MKHSIVLGYFDSAALLDFQRVVLRPLDGEVVFSLLQKYGKREDDGSWNMEGGLADFIDGCVYCPWMLIGRIEKAIEFAKHLHKETGCDIVEQGSNRRLRTDEL